MLADLLLASLSDMDEAEHLQLWAAEADRRLEEFESGLPGEISAEEALRQVRESLS